MYRVTQNLLELLWHALQKEGRARSWHTVRGSPEQLFSLLPSERGVSTDRSLGLNPEGINLTQQEYLEGWVWCYEPVSKCVGSWGWGLEIPRPACAAEDTLSVLVLRASAEKIPSDCLWTSKYGTFSWLRTGEGRRSPLRAVLPLGSSHEW